MVGGAGWAQRARDVPELHRAADHVRHRRRVRAERRHPLPRGAGHRRAPWSRRARRSRSARGRRSSATARCWRRSNQALQRVRPDGDHRRGGLPVGRDRRPAGASCSGATPARSTERRVARRERRQPPERPKASATVREPRKRLRSRSGVESSGQSSTPRVRSQRRRVTRSVPPPEDAGGRRDQERAHRDPDDAPDPVAAAGLGASGVSSVSSRRPAGAPEWRRGGPPNTTSSVPIA